MVAVASIVGTLTHVLVSMLTHARALSCCLCGLGSHVA